jgi:RNA polymerase-binding transcription factor
VTPEQADIARVLRRHLEEIQARIAELARPPEPGSGIGFGKRIGDGTTEAISRLTDIGVGQSLEASLLRLDRALAKLDEGTYGICDACGGAIPEKRLEAMPDSVLCVNCAASAPRAQPPGRR